jgi:beta-galactosidase
LIVKISAVLFKQPSATNHQRSMKRSKYKHHTYLQLGRCFLAGAIVVISTALITGMASSAPSERLSFNSDWLFVKGDPAGAGDQLNYTNIKSWVAVTGAKFTMNPQSQRPKGNIGESVTYTQPAFDDGSWRKLNLPHDWGVEGPFKMEYPGTTGKLPWWGIGWYRKHFNIPASDQGRQLYLDLDGAMAYANVWLNGQYVGGWPYGYASWRVDLTPYIKFDSENVLAIRLDNPSNSSRWYPGGGIYRNVWLVKTDPIHVGHWGTYITTPDASATSATVKLKVAVDNDSKQNAEVSVATEIFSLDANGDKTGVAVAKIAPVNLQIASGATGLVEGTGTIVNPKLWGPPPTQKPNRYAAVTTVRQGDKVWDSYETSFGIRTLKFDPNNGFFINGEHIKINGVCDHHDLGALGSAVNERALQRQLEMLVEMGCNAIRTSHNPPTPELLELADKMGLMVMDEAFDCWAIGKNPSDYHLLFTDWHEQDLRAMLRRDRDHPCVIMWSIGNEIPEQGRGETGAAMAKELSDIVHEEDTTRPAISAMNNAAAGSPFAAAIDISGLNYQGEGRRGTPPQYPIFHQNFPDKFLVGSETASTISSRGEYFFPVASGYGAIASRINGEDVTNRQMSSYDLYYPSWAASPDKVFDAQQQFSFVGGEFVWTGFDYLGEPTPFNSARSSYFGIIDLAGFKKDRFFLYQAHWRPNFPMAHILPHWNWPERVGQVTPVHVYTSGDEGELFLNSKSLGRKTKATNDFRLRWDDVIYQPGELKVVTYKNGKKWATDVMETAGPAARLSAQPDRNKIYADGKDLSFVTVAVTDKTGLTVPRANNPILFEIEGPGEIVATDNGDPTSMESFQSLDRNAFNGLALVIVRAKEGQSGTIKLTAKSKGLKETTVRIKSQSTH